ncbi:tail protein [Neobacillus bataviensis]|uniref:Tail protein n=1 Tax=Neobacillus bataviensis TaxID=220685 RepID=A0A561DSQ2_9BACI|nr:phage tail domain-containing protein [Neobacillus bataviensis]TWE06398.1 tail protein [Neobacillus bataviensis]
MADKLYWIDANGTEQPLSDNNFKVLSGMNGRFMPPVSIVEEEVPFQAGTRKRHVKISARDVDIPLFIQADSEIELRQLIRRTLKIINPFKGGKLKSIAVDGSQRELYCQYIAGMEGAEGKDNKGFWWQKAVLVFHAFDPYWYDSNTIVETFSIGETATFFPFFPMRLSSSSVFADTTINNTGDIETYPEWIINGAGADIILRNLTTGEVTNIKTSLEAGESITIDTRPFHKTVTKSDGTNLYYTLTDDSSLWVLQEGTNTIRIEMSNATNESSVQLSYRNRYWGV